MLAVIQIFISILFIILKYYSGVKDAKKNIERLKNEIKVVCKIFQNLKNLFGEINITITGTTKLLVLKLFLEPTCHTLSEI